MRNSILSGLLILGLACGSEAIAVWDEDDAIAGLRDYFISIASHEGLLVTFVADTQDWKAEYSQDGWWLVSGPFLGIPPLAEAPPTPPRFFTYEPPDNSEPPGDSLYDLIMQGPRTPTPGELEARRAFDARSAEMITLREEWIREHSKGTWKISERSGSVLPFSTSTLGVIPLLVQE